MSTIPGLNFVDLFAAGCVAIYAWERFSRPPWRAMTPKVQWMTALLGYVAAAVGLWWVVASVITSQPETVSAFLAAGSPDAAKEMAKLSAPLASALALTILLPNTPVLKRLDQWMQVRFRELGAIPRAARDLAWQMKRAEFRLPKPLEKSARRCLGEQGLDPDLLLAAPPGSPAGRWVAVVAMMKRLKDEAAAFMPDDPLDPDEEEKKTSGCLRDLEAQHSQAKAQYKALATMASTALAPAARGQAGSQSVLGVFEDGVEDLYHSLCALAACVLLRKNFRAREAIAELRGWGFRIEESQPQVVIRPGDVLAVAFLIFVYFVVVAKYFGFGSGDATRSTYMAVFIAITLAGASACVGVARLVVRGSAPDQRFAFGRYAVAALLAALCWCVLYYVRLAVTENMSIADGIERLGTRWPWMLVSAGAALVLSLLVDADIERYGLPRWAARGCEGVIVGVALAAVAWHVADLLASLSPSGQGAPAPGTLARIDAGMGFILGVFVPHLYRRSAELAHEDPVKRSMEKEFLAVWRRYLPESAGGRPPVRATPAE